MSQEADMPLSYAEGVPRASGDEPKRVDAVFDKPECSPRERG